MSLQYPFVSVSCLTQYLYLKRKKEPEHNRTIKADMPQNKTAPLGQKPRDFYQCCADFVCGLTETHPHYFINYSFYPGLSIKHIKMSGVITATKMIVQCTDSEMP